MAEPVKSILLVDLDGLGRGLAASGGAGMDERLAERIDDWSSAIESGELVEPAGTPHTIAQRRCYAGSASSDEARAAFARAGFEMVECGEAELALCLAVDAMDAAADADDETIFILLTAAPDLTPLVERLRARGHRVAIYADEETTADYQAAADMVIPAGALAAFLADGEAPPAAPPPPAPSADRDRIEAFAREVHEATSIPMFSPRTFAEFFRTLADEVTQHGYHFHDTAKNVADRLAGAGRTVTSRQVVFVVKGLALKGHVFSTSDTAERLAEVFCEQARYLIGGAGITLDNEREALLSAWIAPPAAAPAKPARAPQPEAESKPARQAQPQADDGGTPAKKPAPVRRPEKPTAKPAPRRVPDRPKSAALSARAAAPPQQPKSDKVSADLRAAIAARIAASAKLKPSARPPMKTESPAPAPPEPPASAKAEDTLESSILAAIAEAVDVLVDDGGSGTAEAQAAERAQRQPPARRAAPNRPAEHEPPPPAEEPAEPEEESDDIGDEIQRIVASYNRNRNEDRRG